jgi:outer membrane lipoprotein
MKKRTIRLITAFLLLIMVLWVGGCAPVFPKEALDRVDRRATFKELQKDPEQFLGTWVMVAGVIISIKTTKDGSYIEVLQKPTDRDGRPLDTDETEGRFVAQADQFLDEAVYHPGRQITVIGEVAGKKTMPIDEIMYQYPLLTAKALHLWRPSSGPRFFFGFGVSGRM